MTGRAAVRDAARGHATDRYLAALLAPRDVRDDLVTLAAFVGELARVPLATSEPMIGEIRLQWWWDALASANANADAGAATGHPVADAVVDLVRRGRADKAELQALVDACRDSLTADPAATDKVLAARIDAVEGQALRIAARCVAAARRRAVSPDGRAAIYAAAQGYGLARLLCALPADLARGRTPIAGLPTGAKRSGPPPQSVQRLPCVARRAAATARDVIGGLEADDKAVIATAVLPAALIEPYLSAFETAAARASGWADHPLDITPLRRAWSLFRARHGGWI